MAKQAQPEKQQEPVYRYHWEEAGALWAVREDGHTVVLRAGNIEPRVRVRPRDQRYRHRHGTVLALRPGWGPPPRPVAAVVEFDPQTAPPRDPMVTNPKSPVRVWPVEELEVVP